MQAGPGAGFYILRPETAESLFVLHQLTKDPMCVHKPWNSAQAFISPVHSYREWGFQIFEAIEQRCKTEVAYGALPNVQHVDGRVGMRTEVRLITLTVCRYTDDRMESFFLAETLKYLFLLQVACGSSISHL
jgi:mannosyl-oligosaccharide alpha-1,2-mannosidase